MSLIATEWQGQEEGIPYFRQKFAKLCEGKNKYVDTIHAITRGIHRLSAIVTTEKLYRGMSAKRLSAK